MSATPDILIVIALLVALLALSSLIAGWVNRIWSWPALAALLIGIGLLAYVHLAVVPGGLGFWDLPMAFIHVAALVLN